MQYLRTYLNKIETHGNERLAKSIEKTAEDVGNKYIKSSHLLAMISGYCSEMFSLVKRDKCLELCVKLRILDSLYFYC